MKEIRDWAGDELADFVERKGKPSEFVREYMAEMKLTAEQLRAKLIRDQRQELRDEADNAREEWRKYRKERDQRNASTEATEVLKRLQAGEFDVPVAKGLPSQSALDALLRRGRRGEWGLTEEELQRAAPRLSDAELQELIKDLKDNLSARDAVDRFYGELLDELDLIDVQRRKLKALLRSPVAKQFSKKTIERLKALLAGFDERERELEAVRALAKSSVQRALRKRVKFLEGVAKRRWEKQHAAFGKEVLAFAYQLGKGLVTNNQSGDPNDKLIDVGAGALRHITLDTRIPYTIRFENKPDVPAPAQLINIDDPLPDTLDPSTFEFGDMQFGHHLIEIPPGLMYYYTEVDLRPESNDLIVGIEAEFDPITRVAHWTLTGLDPATGELTEDVFAGFLPPNNEDHDGEGFVSFSIMPRAGLKSGDRIDNVATIVFDWNKPIDTPLVFSTIDIGAPTSSVDALEAESPRDILVSWTGMDEDKGSGIAGYDVSVAVDGGGFDPWLIGTPATAALYPGEPGSTYSFYCVATDAVGHREAKDPVAEATTIARDTPTISLFDPEPGQLLNPGDILAIRWSDWDPNRSGQIGLFWDTDRNLLNNTPGRADATWGTIAEGIPGTGGSNRHDWQIGVDVTPGWVFVYATIADTVASYTDYWSHPIGVGDTDRDGMLDAWELEVVARIPGINDIAGLKPDADEDGDGWTNRQEFDGGTDPTDPLDRPDWSMDLFLDGAGVPVLAFGYSGQATDGWDEALDSATDVLSAHFLAPDGEDDLMLETDIRAARPEGVSWDLAVSPTLGDVEIAWDSTAIPPDHGLFLTETTAGARDESPAVDMSEHESVYVRQDALFRLELEPPRVLDLELEPGWNLVSLPMIPSRGRVYRLFNRQFLGPVWEWGHDTRGDGEYSAADTAAPKVGMWVNWQGGSRAAFHVRGRPIRDAMVTLEAGWNLIGPIEECASPFPHQVWGYDAAAQAYFHVPPGARLLPGKAYWVYSDTDQDIWLADP